MSYSPESSHTHATNTSAIISQESTKRNQSTIKSTISSNPLLKFTFKPITAATIKSYKSECLLLPVYDEKNLPTLTRAIDEKSNGLLKRLLKTGDFTGKSDQITIINCPPISTLDRIILFGCGKKSEFDENKLRKCVTKAAQYLASTKTTHASIAVSDIEISQAYRFISQIITTCLYRQSPLKSKDTSASKLKRITLLGSGTTKQRANATKAIEIGANIGNGANYTRFLGNLPANICTPTYLAQQARTLAKKSPKLSCKVLSETDLLKLNAEAFLSVSQGSKQPGKMIILDYKGSPKKSDAPHVLVGKGITFDTGGISLKPAIKMDEMKYDMCGAATVLGVIQTLVALKLPINVIGVVAAAENMPSGQATRPGDIIQTMSGKTVEILNTDAEGRLVLCDALTYVKRFKPLAVIDIATLTGACIVALGHHTTGLMGNNDGLIKKLLRAGEASFDKVWQLPLGQEYSEQLSSNFADIANIGSPGAGTITAASFLAHFTKEYKWAHLDIAGTAWTSGGKNKGATGRPVPLLMEYLLQQSAEKK